ncbi:MAG: M48 family metalloprotease [Acidimicrobiales bacterium]
MVCVVAQVPERLLDALGVQGWILQLIVVVVAVTGVRAMVRAAFTPTASRTRARSRAWVGSGLISLAGGVVLTLPIYALLRATPMWWLYAWAVFAVITVVGLLAQPLILRAQSGPLERGDAELEGRVRDIGARAGLDLGGVFVAGGEKCNAYVAGLGATRRVVLEKPLTEWPPELVDQVVAHELGHWKLGHAGRRLPLTLVGQLVTFALAGWVLSWPWLLGVAGVSSAGDPASYPLLLVVTPVLMAPARLVIAWYDRAQERAADRFALTLLADPVHFAAMLDKAADEGGAPRRLPWWRRVVASHPPIEERALVCTPSVSTI